MNHLFPFVSENWAQNIAANLHTKTDIQSSVKLEDLAQWTSKYNYLLVQNVSFAQGTFKFLHTKVSTLPRKKKKTNPKHTKNQHCTIRLQKFYLSKAKCIRICNSELAYFRYQNTKIQPASRYIWYNAVWLMSLNTGHETFLSFPILPSLLHPKC